MVRLKYKLIIDDTKEESIVITAKEKNSLILEIEKLIKTNMIKIVGYKNGEFYPLEVADIYCFYTQDGKVYAKVKDEDYLVKERIYQLEDVCKELFVKINQGCLVNIKKILKFESNFSGFIKVVLKNNYSDYISRRELKNVKRRLEI